MTLVPIAAETVFHIGSFPVANTLVNAVIALLLFAAAAVFLRSASPGVPGAFQNLAEMVIEFLLGFFDQVTGDRERSKKFFPLVGTLFLFILVSNWLGLLPGTGSVGIWQAADGTRELVPLLRPANSDLNLTLAMALVSVVGSHILGLVTVGALTHIGKFFPVAGLWKALKSLNPLNILVAVIELVVGLIEVISELAKVASLSLRLFGNVFAGEVLLTVIASLIPFVVPLPFMALELIVGIVQATVFSMLTLVYLTVMSTKPHAHAHEEQAMIAEL